MAVLPSPDCCARSCWLVASMLARSWSASCAVCVDARDMYASEDWIGFCSPGRFVRPGGFRYLWRRHSCLWVFAFKAKKPQTRMSAPQKEVANWMKLRCDARESPGLMERPGLQNRPELQNRAGGARKRWPGLREPAEAIQAASECV